MRGFLRGILIFLPAIWTSCRVSDRFSNDPAEFSEGRKTLVKAPTTIPSSSDESSSNPVPGPGPSGSSSTPEPVPSPVPQNPPHPLTPPENPELESIRLEPMQSFAQDISFANDLIPLGCGDCVGPIASSDLQAQGAPMLPRYIRISYADEKESSWKTKKGITKSQFSYGTFGIDFGNTPNKDQVQERTFLGHAEIDSASVLSKEWNFKDDEYISKVEIIQLEKAQQSTSWSKRKKAKLDVYGRPLEGLSGLRITIESISKYRFGWRRQLSMELAKPYQLEKDGVCQNSDPSRCQALIKLSPAGFMSLVPPPKAGESERAVIGMRVIVGKSESVAFPTALGKYSSNKFYDTIKGIGVQTLSLECAFLGRFEQLYEKDPALALALKESSQEKLKFRGPLPDCRMYESEP